MLKRERHIGQLFSFLRWIYWPEWWYTALCCWNPVVEDYTCYSWDASANSLRLDEFSSLFILYLYLMERKKRYNDKKSPFFLVCFFFLPNSPSKNGWQDAAAYLPFNVAMQSIDREVYCFLFFVVVPITYLAFFMWTKETRTEERIPSWSCCYESSADENENLCCTFPSSLYDYFCKSVCR